jgi:thiamine pyrophosphokinase
MRAVIFANGELERPDAAAALMRPDDFILAADGGLQHVRSLGLKPHLLVGDLDSVTQEDLDWLDAQGVEVLKFPVDKDFTDLELAMQTAQERGFKEIMLVAALGGRMDQTQANIALLNQPDFEECNVYLDDGLVEIRLIKKDLTITGKQGDLVSLLPQCGPVAGVITQRLKYPLRSETLTPGGTRGISNVMLAESAEVSLEKGGLLCIHTRQ